MFLIPANAIAYNGVTSRDWDMSYHLMWSNGKKCRFFLLNSNFTCFLSSRFHHCIFALQDGEVPESLLINVAYFCDNGGLSAIREAFQEADPASLPFSIAHHLINIVTQVFMSNLHTIRHELFMSSIIIYCGKLFTGLTAGQFSQFKTAGLLSGRLRVQTLARHPLVAGVASISVP